MSLNRWVSMCRLKVRMFSRSRMSASRVPGGWSNNRKSATGQFGEYARNDQHRSIGRAQSPRWCMGLYELAERDTLEWHLVSQKSFIRDPLKAVYEIKRLERNICH